MAPPQWAYQVENFVNEPDEELICSICRAVFCDPVMCPCDHVFCRACITKWLQSSRNCPICRKRASSASIKQTVPIIKNLIMKLMLNCHNKGLGCKAQFSVENSVPHLKECEYELVQCKNKPCKDQLFRKDLTEHETRDCPHRYIKCKKCRSKIPTTVIPEKHDCIQALQARLREKSELIKKKNMRIKQLRNENKRLKRTSEDSARLPDASRFMRQRRESSLSPPPEILMYREDFSGTSSYLSSESDERDDDLDDSENNIIIITNGYQSDENAESDSSSDFMETSVEYSRNESPQATAEYRNVESQTLDDLPSNVQQPHTDNARGDSSSFASASYESTSAEASNSVIEETGEGSRPRRTAKRRPTTQKPAKRRYPQVLVSSEEEEEEEDDESESHSSPQSSKQCWSMSSPETNARGAESNQDENSGMAAGPSSAATGSTGAESEETSNTKWHFWSRSKLGQKRGRQAASGTNENTAAGNSSLTVPSRNAVFERTLALLEQYNLESDPEWLPEYASHRGNGTSDSDSSCELEPEFLLDSSSSSSDDYASDLNDDGDKEPNSSAFKWLAGQSSSEDDDPDWDPICYLQNKKRLGEK